MGGERLTFVLLSNAEKLLFIDRSSFRSGSFIAKNGKIPALLTHLTYETTHASSYLKCQNSVTTTQWRKCETHNSHTHRWLRLRNAHYTRQRRVWRTVARIKWNALIKLTEWEYTAVSATRTLSHCLLGTGIACWRRSRTPVFLNLLLLCGPSPFVNAVTYKQR
jgi:hypothetical protein